MSAVPLSVLDLAVVPTGSTSGQALRDSVALAQHVERLGYARFWVAEHHGMPGVASAAPPVLLAAVAGATSRIRVGSGGVMLPNHAPLAVAEQFGTLEGLHPGRVDLGLGRAPGTDPRTAAALRRTTAPLSVDDFPQQVLQLQAYFAGEHEGLLAVPAAGNAPQLWLLGSSGYSAQLAGLLGLPFAFAHHFSAENTLPALALYRSSFRPSDTLAEPYAAVCVSVVCGEDDDEAARLALPGALSFLHLRSGRPGTFPSPEQAAAYPWTAGERAWAQDRAAQQAVGGPETVRRRLDALLADTRADELIVTTMVHDPADRLRSFERVAALAGADAGALTWQREDAAA